jgi:broad specificity phosphatase PhoE
LAENSNAYKSCSSAFYLMRLVLVRHGESVTNAEKRLPVEDTPLTEKGVQQAHLFAELLSNHGVEQLYASPRKRALQTASFIVLESHCELIIEDGLRDYSFGILAGRKEDGTDEEANAFLREWNKDKITYRLPGGENLEDLQKRVRVSLSKILASQKACVAIVSHLYVTRTILAELLGMTLEESRAIQQPNKCVYVIDTVTGEVRYWLDGTESAGLCTVLGGQRPSV